MTSSQRPNLLFIHSDQHSPFVSGCYGDPLVRTPNLDRLAAEGVVFDNAYCPSPLCGPSRMAALTGCHPHQINVWNNLHTLNSGIPTLAHAFGAAGYDPVLIGRLHSNGYDQWRGYATRIVGDHRPNHHGGRAAAHGRFDGTQDPTRKSLQLSGSGQSAYQVHDEEVAAQAVAYLDKLGAGSESKAQSEPFCLSVGFMLPHQPYIANKEDYDRYDGKMTMPGIAEPYSDELHPYLKHWRKKTGIEEVSEAEILRARTAYWGLVTRTDIMIGQVLEALDRNGLRENTLVVYTTDHGEQAGEHGLWWKQTFYEASVKIPLIVSWPGVAARGARCSHIVSTLDLTATMIDALQAPPLPRAVGRSFKELLKTPEHPHPEWENIAFSELCTDDGYCIRMVRKEDWKLVYYHGMEAQLFHLQEDPEERINRAKDPACRPILDELTGRALDGWEPERILKTMKLLKEEFGIVEAWGRNTNPPDVLRWELKPDMHYLENEPPLDK